MFLISKKSNVKSARSTTAFIKQAEHRKHTKQSWGFMFLKVNLDQSRLENTFSRAQLLVKPRSTRTSSVRTSTQPVDFHIQASKIEVDYIVICDILWCILCVTYTHIHIYIYKYTCIWYIYIYISIFILIHFNTFNMYSVHQCPSFGHLRASGGTSWEGPSTSCAHAIASRGMA